MMELEDLIPVKVDGGLVVWHTHEEYARLWRGVDRAAALLLGHCQAAGMDLQAELCECDCADTADCALMDTWCDGDCDGCTCGSA